MTFTIHFICYVGINNVITYLSFIQSEKLFDTRVINRVILAKKLIIRQPFLFLSTILNPWGKMEAVTVSCPNRSTYYITVSFLWGVSEFKKEG